MQLDGNQATGQFWLPAYLAQWNGASLVLPDEDAAALFHTEEAMDQASLGKPLRALGLDDIPLRYGETYEFRVRLMDPTGGGPGRRAMPIHEAPAPMAVVPFRRHVVPEPVAHRAPADFPRQSCRPTTRAFFSTDDARASRVRSSATRPWCSPASTPDPVPLLQAASDRPSPPTARRASASPIPT